MIELVRLQRLKKDLVQNKYKKLENLGAFVSLGFLMSKVTLLEYIIYLVKQM